MIHSARFTVVLDACVLYPAPVRDLLLHLASLELYKPKWSRTIQNEWKQGLLRNRPDLNAIQLDKTIREMNKAFPDANVLRYESLTASFVLPDTNDAHVLAAAIRCQAEVIVTFNLKDFPARTLKKFNIEAQHPDIFVSELIDLNPVTAIKAFENQVSFLKNPPLTASQVLEFLKKSGLATTSEKLRDMLSS